MNCLICPHNCNVDRVKTLGFCKAPVDIKVAHAMLHHWEEPCISGDKGSGAIFFSHCNLKCCYCQNFEISQEGYGKIISNNHLSTIINQLKLQGVHNINFVSPTCYTEQLIQALPEIRKQTGLPIIWNSNGYEKIETLKKLDGLIDVYLPDFKYADDNLAIKYSSAPNYFKTALSAIKEMARQVGQVKLDKNGLIKKGVIIRHLILPGQLKNSKMILKTIKDTFDSTVWLSLMAQYYPTYQADKYPEINHRLDQTEYDEIKKYFDSLHFSGGFFQELESAGQNYTPKFDIKTLD